MVLTYFLAGVACLALTVLFLALQHKNRLPVFFSVLSSWAAVLFWGLAIYQVMFT